MKCNLSRSGFELVSPCPFPTTITITLRALLLFVLSSFPIFFFCSDSSVKYRFLLFCRGYCEMCRMYKIKFGGSTCSLQVISLTKEKQNLNNFKIKVYYSARILCQGTHNVVVIVFANVVVVVFSDVVVVVVVDVVVVFAFGLRRSGNVFARQRGATQVLVE